MEAVLYYGQWALVFFAIVAAYLFYNRGRQKHWYKVGYSQGDDIKKYHPPENGYNEYYDNGFVTRSQMEANKQTKVA